MDARSRRYQLDSLEIGKRLEGLFHARGEGSVLDPKSNELLMLALACVCRCSHRTQEQIHRALEAGATKDEIADVLLAGLYWVERLCERPVCGDTERVRESSTGAAPYAVRHRADKTRSPEPNGRCLQQVFGCVV